MELINQVNSNSVYGSLSETQKYKEYVNFVLYEDYAMQCIKKCVTNFNSPLEGKEKLCLAKCQDRAHDFLVLNEKNLNPYNQAYARKYVDKLDGVFIQDD